MGKPIELDGLYVVERGDVLFTLWNKPASESRFHALSRRIEDFAARAGGSVIVCQLILTSSTPPDAKGRAAALDAMRRNEASMRRFIICPLGDALWLGLVRTVVRGFFILMGRSEVLAMAANEIEALDRIVERASDRTPPRMELRREIEALKQAAGVMPAVASPGSG
jgi:hypothetical protein